MQSLGFPVAGNGRSVLVINQEASAIKNKKKHSRLSSKLYVRSDFDFYISLLYV